jgi:hypothetical protein
VRVIGISAAVLAVGCVRDPVPAECPTIGVGELIVTEFRGPQQDPDALGTWVEIFNASGAIIDLEGIKVRFRKKDGSSEVPIIVRRSVTVAAGAYAVLGLVLDDANLPSHINYGFLEDFHQDFLPAAAVDVEACGTRIDRAVYDVLPKTGTYSFGLTPPDADANDIPINWCVNAASAGTPQQANPACP